MNILDNFLKKGLINFGSIIDKKKCKELHDKVFSSRDLSEGLFRSEKDFLSNPDSKKTNPGKGKNNFAEKFDLSFIEKNPVVKKNIDLLVGEDHEILLKNFVIGVPDNWIPTWLKKKTEKQLAANLGSYVKPEYRDVTYFRGIDFHMDLIDHVNSIGDNITVYLYLNDVTEDMSPLNVIEGSHVFGATKFPHYLKNNTVNSIEYGSSEKNYKKFQKKVLIAETGSLFLWSSFILHGTQPQKCDTPRISLRYDIKPNKKNKNTLIAKFLNEIQGDLSMPIVRDDIDLNSTDHKQIKFQKILK